MERSNVFEVPETTIKIVSELLEEAIDLIEEKHAYFKTEKDSLCTENLENRIDKKLGGDIIMTTKLVNLIWRC